MIIFVLICLFLLRHYVGCFSKVYCKITILKNPILISISNLWKHEIQSKISNEMCSLFYDV